MNVALKPFDFSQALARAGLGTDCMPLARSGSVGAAGFQEAIGEALGAVSLAQSEAARVQRQIAPGNATVSLEQMTATIEKAKVGFEATLQVRNRLVQAYTDIMAMQV
ncbi:MAG: flagellar hook-basal body complex protein FliE [Caldimonas sp.]